MKPGKWDAGIVVTLLAAFFGVLRPSFANEAQHLEVRQFFGKFGDLLGLHPSTGEGMAKEFHDILSRQLGELDKRGVHVEFSEGPNPFKAITASNPVRGSKVVQVFLDRRQIESLYANPVERREMVWFALLHELQNAARAATFRRLDRLGQTGQMSESDWVKAEVSTEVNATCAAYALYVADVYPKLHLLGGESLGVVQAAYGVWIQAGKDKMLDYYIRTELGDHYRKTYRGLRKQTVVDAVPADKPADL